MKKFTVILAAFAAFAAVSCNKEIPVETPAPEVQDGFKTVTITANIEGQTKTSYDADGKFSWTKGDQISVLASDNNFYTFTAKETAESSEFTGEIPAECSISRISYFPASDKHTYDTSWWSEYSIDEYKDMKGLVSAEIPMYGVHQDDDSFTFTHLTGAIQLTFTNIPDGVEEVEISVKNVGEEHQCKFSGLWKISTASWEWEAAYAANESEATYTRKVPVQDNSAKIYVPYLGGIWYSSIINITGYDAGGNELALLTNKKMGGNGTAIERAQIVPYKALALPDYIDFTTLDWDQAQISYVLPDGASSSRQVMKDLKLIADNKYIYVKIRSSKAKFEETESNYLGFYLYDTTTGTQGDGYWGWFQNAIGDVEYEGEHDGSFEEGTVNLNMTFNGKPIPTMTDVLEDDVYWYIAIPRTAHVLLSSSEKVYVAFILDKDWSQTGALPDKYDSMLEVTLP